MATLFRTEAVERVLGLLYLNHQREMTLSEILTALGGTASRRTVIYTLDQLVADGYIEKRRSGKGWPAYRANRENFLFEELRSIATKTLGGFRPLIEAVRSDENIVAAAVYGSHANGTARATSDIDLLVVVREVDSPQVLQLTRALDDAGERIGRQVNLRTYGVDEFDRRRTGGFLARILSEPLVLLKGDLGA